MKIPIFKDEDNLLSPKEPELLSPHNDLKEARKLNESIFNRAPTLNDKNDKGNILKNLGDDKCHDIGKSNEYFSKIKTIEYCSSFLTIANIWNCMILYETDYINEDGQYDKYIDTQLNLSTAFSLMLFFLVNFRYWVELKWKKTKNFVTQEATLWTTGSVKWMIAEGIISIVSPHGIFKEWEFVENNLDYETKIYYPVNHLLCSFIFFKSYAIMRTLFLTNKYSMPRSQRVCAMTGTYANVEFSIKGTFKEYPNTSLAITTLISALMCAQMLRIYERPLSAVSGQRFDKYATSIWNIIVTMSTVGYGDVYPKTIFGRILGAFVCIWGVVVESMMVVTLSEGLELTTPQRNSYTLLQRLFYRDDLQMRAVRALRSIFLHKKKIKAKNLLYKTKRINLKKKSLKLEMTFKRQMYKFKKKESEMRKFNMATEITYLYNKIYNLQEEFEKIWKTDKEVRQIQNESMNKLQVYFNKKASDDMKNKFNYTYKQKEMRMTGQSFFESQLQTSLHSNSKDVEEDKEAEYMNSVHGQKLL
ncbi:unnamed protein product [Moneuplotes crassus]|uniref:Potassium channel domain-containing protein n=1 Tax=Euplotes crassus TaxID=5936 RepID=A0AAD1U859_EUPCR|nr:unnamed protein product [Moneuplotes crassus]